MKKFVSIALAVIFLFSTAYAAEIDLSGLSLAELIELQQRVTMAMWETDEWQEVTVPAGVYQIGVDIPAGHWSLSAPDGQMTNAAWGTKLTENKKEIDYKGTFYYPIILVSEKHIMYDTMSQIAATITDLELEEGQWLVIEMGSIVFTPYTGKPSLGFK